MTRSNDGNLSNKQKKLAAWLAKEQAKFEGHKRADLLGKSKGTQYFIRVEKTKSQSSDAVIQQSSKQQDKNPEEISSSSLVNESKAVDSKVIESKTTPESKATESKTTDSKITESKTSAESKPAITTAQDLIEFILKNPASKFKVEYQIKNKSNELLKQEAFLSPVGYMALNGLHDVLNPLLEKGFDATIVEGQEPCYKDVKYLSSKKPSLFNSKPRYYFPGTALSKAAAALRSPTVMVLLRQKGVNPTAALQALSNSYALDMVKQFNPSLEEERYNLIRRSIAIKLIRAGANPEAVMPYRNGAVGKDDEMETVLGFHHVLFDAVGAADVALVEYLLPLIKDPRISRMALTTRYGDTFQNVIGDLAATGKTEAVEKIIKLLIAHASLPEVFIEKTKEPFDTTGMQFYIHKEGVLNEVEKLPFPEIKKPDPIQKKKDDFKKLLNGALRDIISWSRSYDTHIKSTVQFLMDMGADMNQFIETAVQTLNDEAFQFCIDSGGKFAASQLFIYDDIMRRINYCIEAYNEGKNKTILSEISSSKKIVKYYDNICLIFVEAFLSHLSTYPKDASKKSREAKSETVLGKIQNLREEFKKLKFELSAEKDFSVKPIKLMNRTYEKTYEFAEQIEEIRKLLKTEKNAALIEKLDLFLGIEDHEKEYKHDDMENLITKCYQEKLSAKSSMDTLDSAQSNKKKKLAAWVEKEQAKYAGRKRADLMGKSKGSSFYDHVDKIKSQASDVSLSWKLHSKISKPLEKDSCEAPHEELKTSSFVKSKIIGKSTLSQSNSLQMTDKEMEETRIIALANKKLVLARQHSKTISIWNPENSTEEKRIINPICRINGITALDDNKFVFSGPQTPGGQMMSVIIDSVSGETKEIRLDMRDPIVLDSKGFLVSGESDKQIDIVNIKDLQIKSFATPPNLQSGWHLRSIPLDNNRFILNSDGKLTLLKWEADKLNLLQTIELGSLDFGAAILLPYKDNQFFVLTDHFNLWEATADNKLQHAKISPPYPKEIGKGYGFKGEKLSGDRFATFSWVSSMDFGEDDDLSYEIREQYRKMAKRLLCIWDVKELKPISITRFEKPIENICVFGKDQIAVSFERDPNIVILSADMKPKLDLEEKAVVSSKITIDLDKPVVIAPESKRSGEEKLAPVCADDSDHKQQKLQAWSIKEQAKFALNKITSLFGKCKDASFFNHAEKEHEKSSKSMTI